MKRTAPFITPFAIFSAVLALGATNVAVNTVTHTSEGKPKSEIVKKSSVTSTSESTDDTKPVSSTVKSTPDTTDTPDEGRNSTTTNNNQDQQTDNQTNTPAGKEKTKQTGGSV